MNHIPQGFSALTVHLNVEGVEDFLRFVGEAFGASVTMVTRHEDGRVRHAEVAIEGVTLECAEARPEWPSTRVGLHLFVRDPDAAHARAVAAGAQETYPVTTHPYGERSGGVRDRWGNDWYLAAVVDPEARRKA